MIENIIGKRYAEALSSSIQEDSRLSSALENLTDICGAFEGDPQLARFFANPAISDENKMGFLKDLEGQIKIEPEVKNLLALLVERRKILRLKNILEFFQVTVDQRLGRVRTQINSAEKLSDKQIEGLTESLRKITGKDVLVEAVVDESLIGGIVLRMGSLVADASVKNRLAIMKRYIQKEEVA
jgi:F-type H+-transporting ATPase subunit delta